MDLERLTALLDALTGRWPQVLAAFGGAALAAGLLAAFGGAALAAGLLGALTRALGVKEDDGLKGLRGRKDGPSA